MLLDFENEKHSNVNKSFSKIFFIDLMRRQNPQEFSCMFLAIRLSIMYTLLNNEYQQCLQLYNYFLKHISNKYLKGWLIFPTISLSSNQDFIHPHMFLLNIKLLYMVLSMKTTLMGWIKEKYSFSGERQNDPSHEVQIRNFQLRESPANQTKLTCQGQNKKLLRSFVVCNSKHRFHLI